MTKRLWWWLTLTMCCSCNKLLDVPPGDGLTTAQVFADEAKTRAVRDGMYINIMKAFGPLNGYPSKLCGLGSDELSKIPLSGIDTSFLYNSLKPDDPTIALFWSLAYASILNANALIAGLDQSTAAPAAERRQWTAEALFIRALLYFYLVNLFGDVPLVLSNDYQQTAYLPRAPSAIVYQQIIADLNLAQADLPPLYGNGAPPDSVLQPGSWAATALLARVWLTILFTSTIL